MSSHGLPVTAVVVVRPGLHAAHRIPVRPRKHPAADRGRNLIAANFEGP